MLVLLCRAFLATALDFLMVSAVQRAVQALLPFIVLSSPGTYMVYPAQYQLDGGEGDQLPMLVWCRHHVLSANQHAIC